MSQENISKEATPLILGLLFPGLGHIVLGRKKQGVRIAIAFVILSYISGNILNTFIASFLSSVEAPQISYSIIGLTFIPPFAVWLWQVKNLMKIT